MFKKISLILSLFATPLWASFSEPFRWEYSTGYRNDRIHWHLQNPGDGGALLYSEIDRNLEFWENALSIKIYHRDLYLFLGGDYSAFGSGGDVTQKYANLSYTTDQPSFLFTPQGWAADGVGHFGYCVNLTDGRTYKTILIPLVGFSIHYELLNRSGGAPAPWTSNNAIGADSYSMFSSLPQNLNFTWYGFLLGGAFHIDPGGRLLFEGGYSYNWLHLRFHTRYANTLSMGAPLFTETTSYSSISGKTGSNVGQSGWIKVDYRIDRFWRIGVGAALNYFSSRFFGVKNHEQINGASTVKVPQTLKVRWTSVSGTVNLSRDF